MKSFPLPDFNRRDFLKATGLLMASSQLPSWGHAAPLAAGQPARNEWIRRTRIVIAEGYNAPFYPALDYEAERAVSLVEDLHGDALRYPAAAFTAYFPTKSGFPIHPQLKGDPMARSLDLCHQKGLKFVAYLPLNNAFMSVASDDPRYADWTMRSEDGRRLETGQDGYGKFYEACLNSPAREVIRQLVHEVVAQYPVDVMYLDGPYQGMAHASAFCHCRHCEAAYRKRFGVPVPDSNTTNLEERIQYMNWMSDEVVIKFLREITDLIRQTRDVPVLFNDTALLSRLQWRSRGFPDTDGFMFEAPPTPEAKLFNLQLGRSTGRVVWTYVGSYNEYDSAHLRNRLNHGWYSDPFESQELLMDGAAAITGGGAMLYWGLSRFYYQPRGPLAYESGRYVKSIFDFFARHETLLSEATPRPQAGILVSKQTIDWFNDRYFIERAYANAYHGAFRLFKAASRDAEPFLDLQMTPEQLARYPLIYAPNVVCLSDEQCRALEAYVRNGGRLVATHLTSVADEYGRKRKDFGLAGLFGASFVDPEPMEMPDLYLRLPSGEEIPQDPQILRIRADGAEVLAHTYDRGHHQDLGPAIVRRTVGRGEVIYIGSSLEAVYDETLMDSTRLFFASLFDRLLPMARNYEVPFQRGLMAHLTATADHVLLHLLADTGNRASQSPSCATFVPLTNVQVRIGIPDGRGVRSVRLLRAEREVPAARHAGWLEVTVPSVFIHEVVAITLS